MLCCVVLCCVCLYDFGRFHDIHLFPSHFVKSFFSYAHVLKYAYAEKKLLPRERKKSENIREIVQKSHIYTFCTHFVLNKKRTLRVREEWIQQTVSTAYPIHLRTLMKCLFALSLRQARFVKHVYMSLYIECFPKLAFLVREQKF